MRSERLPMTARLALIGLVAGVFSTLFGVGGGIVVVPLLVALAAFPLTPPPRPRSGRSSSRRPPASFSTPCAARCDRLCALVGIPAVVGALVGTHVQQRLSGRALTLAFAGLLAVIGVWLIAV